VTTAASPGLCGRCAHAREIVSDRGPRYLLCGRAREEPHRYPKYPHLPVFTCRGFEPAAPPPAGESHGA